MVVGGLEAQNKNGFRVSVTGGESRALLFEISSGDLICLMGYPFSNLRISATVGIAIERFTEPKARTVAMIGSGRLALPALEPAVAVRPIERVLVYSRSAENREAFARRASTNLKVDIVLATSAQQAIEQADFVLVSTNSPAPAVHDVYSQTASATEGKQRPRQHWRYRGGHRKRCAALGQARTQVNREERLIAKPAKSVHHEGTQDTKGMI